MPTFGGVVVSTGGQATGRRMLLDVMQELAQPVDASDSSVMSLARQAFQAAVRKMNIKGNWPWELQQEEINVTQDEKFSAVQGAIKKPLAMHELTASGGTEMERIDYIEYSTFIENWDLNVSGKPRLYTIPNMFENGQKRWYPTPGASYTYRLDYYRVTPIPKKEQETIEIPEYVIETYMAFAWYEFLKRLSAQQRPFELNIAKADRRDAFRELSAHVANATDMSRHLNAVGGPG